MIKDKGAAYNGIDIFTKTNLEIDTNTLSLFPGTDNKIKVRDNFYLEKDW